MSDPVSNAEIEDVLSSIRRLVSEEPSPLIRRKPAAEAAKERFVLTPALRVPDNADDAADAEDGGDRAPAEPVEPAAAIDDAEAALQADDAEAALQADDAEERYISHRQTLEGRIAELEAALQNTADEWEPDGSEMPSAEPISMPALRSRAEPADEVADDAAEEEPAAPETAAESAVPDLSEADDALIEADDATAAGEPETPLLLDDPAPDTAAEARDDVAAGAEDAASVVFRHGPAKAETAMGAEIAPDAEADEPGGGEAAEARAFEAAEEPASAPEAAEAAQDEADAPDQEADPRGTVLSADAEDDSLTANLHDEAEADGLDGEEDGFDMFSSDAVLDENALRELVGQLVREELQGVLGERITRNVRRLVRREIQRALAMNELE